MERTLTRFVRALRAAGAPVSPAEAIDAARVTALVGYKDRSLLRESLGVVLAKSAPEKERHDALFERFFSTDRAAAEAFDEQEASEAGGADGDERGGEATAEDFLALARNAGSAATALALERAADAAGADEIRFATQSAYYTRRMLEQLGVEALERRLLERLEARTPEAEAEARALMGARAELARLARETVGQRFDLFGKSATETFMNEVVSERAIGELGLTDMARMKTLVARLAKRLADKHARRRKVRDRGRLDVARTLRASAGYDGVPFDVIWKEKKKDRPKIVAICDVSGSVSRYVAFLLLLLFELKEKVTDLRTFAFSARLGDVGDKLDQQNFEAAMAAIVREYGAGATDYGRALLDLKEAHADVIDRRTTVLVLGDGRSNDSDPRLDLFAEIADQAKRVVWLCPEPEGMWGSGDSCMLAYRPFCSRLSHCATVLDLERAIDEILLAY
jgi:uncharacterized protein with von Willebrand factor type A (vWA) domain